ncbi:MAG: hypothetical protein WB988_10645 [Candidatus Nitrosopolaris sp.]
MKQTSHHILSSLLLYLSSISTLTGKIYNAINIRHQTLKNKSEFLQSIERDGIGLHGISPIRPKPSITEEINDLVTELAKEDEKPNDVILKALRYYKNSYVI